MATSKNMKYKVPVLGMTFSPYLLQHVTTSQPEKRMKKIDTSGLVVHSVVIVSNETISNETIHERNNI